MAEPIAAQKSPYKVDLEAGKKYWWCVCGRSTKQPYCDGSHKDTGLQPLMFQAEKTGAAWLCGCKSTAKKPFCDGTHSRI
jgi:CDGSH iron-sulfur domain-containing protein 3